MLRLRAVSLRFSNGFVLVILLVLGLHGFCVKLQLTMVTLIFSNGFALGDPPCPWNEEAAGRDVQMLQVLRSLVGAPI